MNKVNRLKSIFAKQIGKDVADLTSKDLELFADAVSFNLIKDNTSNNETIIEEFLSPPFPPPQNLHKSKIRCRNCDNIIISISNKQRFGRDTVSLSIYCSYWYNKNKLYKNALYNIKLNDVACSKIVYHKNVLDLHNINLDGLDEIKINVGDFSTLPIASFIDKGYNLKKHDNKLYLVREYTDTI